MYESCYVKKVAQFHADIVHVKPRERPYAQLPWRRIDRTWKYLQEKCNQDDNFFHDETM
jgi:hypothetical protein